MSLHTVLAGTAAAWLVTAVPLAAQQAPVVAAGAATQASVLRTTTDRVMVWRHSPSQVIATLPIDVDLDALAREGQWYLVRLPQTYALPGLEFGYVFAAHVRLVSGPSPPDGAPVTPDNSLTPAHAAAPPPPFFRARGYGSLDYEWFLANKSFDAFLSQRGGLFYGGGAQAIFGHLFVDVGFEHFRKVGQRVIVFDGEVFRLGIPDTVTMEPLTVSGGYRFAPAGKWVAYAGGGYQSLHFKEIAEFAAPGQNHDQNVNGFVVLGGVEFTVLKWMFVSGEGRFTGVPNAIGKPGSVPEQFNEHNLGGYGLVVKVLVGN